jgi:hypothetical protein
VYPDSGLYLHKVYAAFRMVMQKCGAEFEASAKNMIVWMEMICMV